MRTIRVKTTAKDILALIDCICSQKKDLQYTLCGEKDVRLEYSFPDYAPRWIVPVSIVGYEEIKYFIFDHEFCFLTVRRSYTHRGTEGSVKLTETAAWASYFYHWIIEKQIIESDFTTISKVKPICLPDYWYNRDYCEHQPACPVLFLRAKEVINGFPFRDIVNGVESVELKVTSDDEPVWLLTKNTGEQFVIYPCALHRFCDELKVDGHDFGKLRNPKKGEEFLVGHCCCSVVYPLIAFKVENEQELSVVRFSEMNVKCSDVFIEQIL